MLPMTKSATLKMLIILWIFICFFISSYLIIEGVVFPSPITNISITSIVWWWFFCFVTLSSPIWLNWAIFITKKLGQGRINSWQLILLSTTCLLVLLIILALIFTPNYNIYFIAIMSVLINLIIWAYWIISYDKETNHSIIKASLIIAKITAILYFIFMGISLIFFGKYFLTDKLIYIRNFIVMHNKHLKSTFFVACGTAIKAEFPELITQYTNTITPHTYVCDSQCFDPFPPFNLNTNIAGEYSNLVLINLPQGTIARSCYERIILNQGEGGGKIEIK